MGYPSLLDLNKSSLLDFLQSLIFIKCPFFICRKCSCDNFCIPPIRIETKKQEYFKSVCFILYSTDEKLFAIEKDLWNRVILAEQTSGEWILKLIPQIQVYLFSDLVQFLNKAYFWNLSQHVQFHYHCFCQWLEMTLKALYNWGSEGKSHTKNFIGVRILFRPWLLFVANLAQ